MTSAREPTALTPGTTVGDRFRVVRLLGRGGMAEVYEAENTRIGKRVAVKILADDLLTSRTVRARFLREARAAAAIRSPYICDVFDTGTFEERPFIVMELLDGESLYRHLSRRRRLAAESVVLIATHVCRGLATAHAAGVVHRDLKPENIFLISTPEGATVTKVLDFGLAAFYEEAGGDEGAARITREGAVFGTPAYMSPEQARGGGSADHRADLWALGAIVYECLTGKTVWDTREGVAATLEQVARAPLPDPRALRPELPDSFADWFARALARDVNDRFQDATAMAASLMDSLDPLMPRLSRIALLSEPPAEAVPGLDKPSDRPPRPVAPVVAQRPDPPTQPPARASDGTPWAIAGLVTLSAAALAAWVRVVGLSGPALAQPATAPSVAASSTDAAEALVLRESTDDGKLLGEGQRLLADGNTTAAVHRLRQGWEAGGSAAAHGLLAQARVAATADGACRTVALGRPRPFPLREPASPALAVATADGAVAVWVDAHASPPNRHAHAVRLDDALRRVSEPLDLTPTGNDVTLLRLQPGPSGPVLLTRDGAVVRALELRPDGAALRTTEPSALPIAAEDAVEAVVAGGAVVVVWSHREGEWVTVRAARARLGDSAAPEVVELARFADDPQAPAEHHAPRVALAADGERVHVALRRAAGDRRALVHGVLLGGEGPPTVEGELREVAVTPATAVPQLACRGSECVITWNSAGQRSAVLRASNDEVKWSVTLPHGLSAAAAVADGEAVVSWFEASRVRVAVATAEGLGPASVVAKVTGYQPPPSVMADATPHGWLLAFRDFEAGHLETYLLRVRCQ